MERVLVVDDEPQILRALKIILRDAGFEVLQAASVKEALDMAAAEGVDVIIVDHHKCAAQLPRAFALVNPNRLDELEGAAHGHLAAVGCLINGRWHAAELPFAVGKGR